MGGCCWPSDLASQLQPDLDAACQMDVDGSDTGLPRESLKETKMRKPNKIVAKILGIGVSARSIIQNHRSST